MKYRLFIFTKIAMTIALFTMLGCNTLQPPRATVTQVKLTDVTEQGARVTFTVQLDNPSGVALPLTHSRYTVKLAGQTYTGTTIPRATMPRRAQQTVTLAAAVPLKVVVSQGQAVSLSGSIEYEPPGQIRRIFTDSGVPLPRVSFSHQGPIE